MVEKLVCEKLTLNISTRISEKQHWLHEKGRSAMTNLVEFFNFAFDEMEN
jgi:hypothetical protein